jgi:hypothetical protein
MREITVKHGISGLFVLIVTVILIWWLQQDFIVQDEYVLQPGNDGISVYNRFYAAQRLLERSGLETQSVRNLPDAAALQATDTLILNTPGQFISERRAGGLLDWVNKGGHLIFSVQHAYDGRQHDDAGSFFSAGNRATLLQTLELVVTETGYRTTVLDLGELGDTAVPLQVKFQSTFDLHDPQQYAFWQAGDGGRTYLLRYNWGDGAISVFTDLGVFDNNRIGDYAHADFLWALLHAGGTPGKVWLQYAPQMPSLFELLWRHAWMFIIAMLLTLAAVIWAGNLRLGPELHEYTGEQRRLSDHLRASGRFLWRRGAPEALLEAARERTLQRLRRHHPHWQTLTDDERIGHIVNLTGLERARVHSALFREGGVNAAEFQQIIRLLKRIGNEV